MREYIITSKAKRNILKLFLTNPNTEFYVREISRRTGEPLNAVRRELGYLGKAKGSFDLICAAKIILSQMNGVVFDLVGQELATGEMEQLNTQVADAGLEQQSFSGHRRYRICFLCQ